LTSAHQVLGTLPYMSPEQLQGRPLDPRSDLYSFGVLLYELATGQRPFRGATASELVTAILRGAPPRPETLRSGFPEALGRLLQRCLAKDPQERFGSARELREALERL
jgi:serine/threonine-protein kinase